MKTVGYLFTMACLATAALLPASTAETASSHPKVTITTQYGSIVVELFPERAPVTVARFLARAGLGPLPEGISEVAPYAGSMLCESRAHGFMVFGCVPAPPIGPKPAAPGKEPPQRDEIDAAAMGLAERKIVDIKERDWLWQQEILPRYTLLRQGGRPVPEGLAALVQAVKDRGPSGMSVLEGKSKMWYLEAVGYRYVPGASAFPVRRGAVTTASFWPGEADERFMVALSDMPHWDGRATVFGRVVTGWETLEAIERVPVDKAHRPLTMVTIAGMARADADTPAQKKGSTR